MEFKEQDLLAYACDKFEQNKYDEALETFVLLYTRGYEKEWIRQNIYQCYVNCNDEEFRQTFESNINGTKIKYEDCSLDFVPYQEGKYYIFDKKEEQFVGVFSTDELIAATSDTLLQKMEFSAVTLGIEWDWRSIFSILTQANVRKIYMVCEDLKRGASFFKIPELREYLKNIWLFENVENMQRFFHENTSQYLPGIWYGDVEKKAKFEQMIQQEHQYRLTPQGRNADNVLLTIAIPSYHRGHLLKQRIENLQNLPYDAEIEFVVSKNGTDVYQKEYDEVSQRKDSRLIYFDHKKDLKYEVNWHYAVEMSHGKYVLLVSDEDDIVLDKVEHYFALFRDFSDISLLRAKTKTMGCLTTQRVYGEKGFEAFKNCFLKQNYISGLIFRRKDFLESDLLKLEKYSDNVFYQTYPHEWWCAEMNKKGAYLEEPVVLIEEKTSMAKEEWGYDKEVDENTIIPSYATYEARLEQAKGEVEFLHIMIKDDADMLEYGMDAIIRKANWLLGIARMRKYDIEHYEMRLREYVEICMKAIMDLQLDGERTKRLLECLQTSYIDLLKEHSDLIENEKMNV